MGLFDSIKEMAGGIAENIGAEIPVGSDIQEHVGGVAEQGQQAAEDIQNNIGL